MSDLVERLLERARTYLWDSRIFYASDGELMRKSAENIEKMESALLWIYNNSHNESAHYAVSRDALGKEY